MDPRLRNSQQTILQKRVIHNNNELYEMMRSRHVYYVQKELRKELDRTLKALKQAEKIRMVGFRIQKAMFLKRIGILEKRRRHLINIPATRNNTILHNGFSGIVAPSEKVVTDSPLFNQPKSRIPPNHSNSSISTSAMSNENVAQVNTAMGQLSLKPKETLQDAKITTSLNSEWMCSVQVDLQKTHFPVVAKAEHKLPPIERDPDKSCTQEMLKPSPQSEFSQTTQKLTTENKWEPLQMNTVLSHTIKDSNKVKDYSRKIKKEEMLNQNLIKDNHLSRNQNKFGSDRTHVPLAALIDVNKSAGKIYETEEPNKLSVVNETNVLSVCDSNKNEPVHAREHCADNTHAMFKVSASGSDFVDRTNETSRDNAVAKLSIDNRGIKSSMDGDNPVPGNVKLDSVIKNVSQHTQPDTTGERSQQNSHHKKAGSRRADVKNSLALPKLLSPQRAPYLDRSKNHTSDKVILLKNQARQNDSASTVSLERTVTMIFVEDTLDEDERPKSQFDFEAWLTYNRRKRGYTKIFDDKSSLVTTTDTGDETCQAFEKKRGPKNNVRFHMYRKTKVQTDPKPDVLSFREKSQEWYMNFLKDKRNKRYGDRNTDLYRNRESHVPNRWSYTLLPKIGTALNSDDDSSETRRKSKLANSIGNHIHLKETTDQKLKRMKDHSQLLQMKVQNFIYS